ncbi:MAG TPA: hypothetical protein VH328_04270 [Burkholderiaceae bacterium]|nr:hypothetical protein [Burkholderiaceae bacterium]
MSTTRRGRGEQRCRVRHHAGSLGACAALSALAGCAGAPLYTPASARSPNDVLQAITYPGPVRPLVQVATIYAYDGGEGAEAGWICDVDGHVLQRRTGTAVHCPAVVYVAPGAHVIGWHHQGPDDRIGYGTPGDAMGAGTLHIQAMPGGVYRLVPDASRRTITVVPVRPEGGALRYADINPRFEKSALPYPPVR